MNNTFAAKRKFVTKSKKCLRCGKAISHYHYLITAQEIGYVCADDRLCYQCQQSRKIKLLHRLQTRWSDVFA